MLSMESIKSTGHYLALLLQWQSPRRKRKAKILSPTRFCFAPLLVGRQPAAPCWSGSGEGPLGPWRHHRGWGPRRQGPWVSWGPGGSGRGRGTHGACLKRKQTGEMDTLSEWRCVPEPFVWDGTWFSHSQARWLCCIRVLVSVWYWDGNLCQNLSAKRSRVD